MCAYSSFWHPNLLNGYDGGENYISPPIVLQAYQNCSSVSKAFFSFIGEKNQTKLKKSLFPLFDGLISITHVQLVTKQSPITK